MISYVLGNVVLLTSPSFATPAGVLTDPTTTTLKVRDPTGVETDYTGVTLTHVSTGVFSYVLTPAISGMWHYRWKGVGAVVAANEQSFEVRPSDFSS